MHTLTVTNSSCVSSCFKLLLNCFLVLIGQCLVTFYCNISNVKKNIGRTITSLCALCETFKKKENEEEERKKEMKEGKKTRREREMVVKASEHVILFIVTRIQNTEQR